jgi:hypothetical protein
VLCMRIHSTVPSDAGLLHRIAQDISSSLINPSSEHVSAACDWLHTPVCAQIRVLTCPVTLTVGPGLTPYNRPPCTASAFLRRRDQAFLRVCKGGEEKK